MKNIDNDFLTMNYWEIICNISKMDRVTLRDSVQRFYNNTHFPSSKVLDLILNEKNLIPFNSKVEIHDFIIDRLNKKTSVVVGINISHNMISYILDDYADYLFGEDSLKIIS